MIAVCQVLVHILQCFFVDWLRQQKVDRFLLSAENPRHEVPSARKQKEGSRKSLRVCYVCRGCGLYGCRYTKLLHSYFLIRNWSSINRMDASISVPNYRGCQQKWPQSCRRASAHKKRTSCPWFLLWTGYLFICHIWKRLRKDSNLRCVTAHHLSRVAP